MAERPQMVPPEIPEFSPSEFKEFRAAVVNLRANIVKAFDARTLSQLEEAVNRAGDVSRAQFCWLMLPLLQSAARRVTRGARGQLLPNSNFQPDLLAWESALSLFEDINVHNREALPWSEIIEFVLNRSEHLRVCTLLGPGPEPSLCQTSAWRAARKSQTYSPASLKCLFDAVHYVPESDLLVVLEESSSKFHVHQATSGIRRRAVTPAHFHDILGITHLDAPYSWVVTASLDVTVFDAVKKTLQEKKAADSSAALESFDQKDHPSLVFWDYMFAKLFSWKLNVVVGTLMYAPGRRTLFGADYFHGKIHAWTLPAEPIVLREQAQLDMPRSTTSHLQYHYVIEGHSDSVMSLLWVPHMEVVLSGSRDTTIQVWDCIIKTQARVLRGHARTVTCLAYSEVARLAVSGGFENTLYVWDINSGVKCGALRGHSCAMAAVAVLPNSAQVASMDLDGTLKLWALPQMTCTQTLQVADSAGSGDGLFRGRALCVPDRDGNKLCVVGSAVAFFERDPPDAHATSDTPIGAMCYSSRRGELYIPVRQENREGDRAGSSSMLGSFRVWDLTTCRVTEVLDGILPSNITVLSMDQEERRVGVGGEGGEMAILNVASMQVLARLVEHAYEVMQIQFLPNAIITLGIDKVLMIHDDEEKRMRPNVLRSIDLSEDPGLRDCVLTKLDSSRTHRQIAIGTAEGQLQWLNLDSQKEEGRMESGDPRGHSASVLATTFFTRVPLMASCDQDGVVSFWSLRPLPLFEAFARGSVLPAPDRSERKRRARAGDEPLQLTAAVFLDLPDGVSSVFVGTDAGTVMRWSIAGVLTRAAGMVSFDGHHMVALPGRAEEEHHDAAGSRKKKEGVPMPPEGKYEMLWSCAKASRHGQIELLVPVVGGGYSAVGSVGQDMRVRILDLATGAILATLEQGPGAMQVPMDPAPLLAAKRAMLAEVCATEEELVELASTEEERPAMRKSASAPTMPRVVMPPSPKPTVGTKPQKQLGGTIRVADRTTLPPLASGMNRTRQRFGHDTLQAAERLANALSALGDHDVANRFRALPDASLCS